MVTWPTFDALYGTLMIDAQCVLLESSAQVHRSVALALMYAECKLNVVPNREHLPKRRKALLAARQQSSKLVLPF